MEKSNFSFWIIAQDITGIHVKQLLKLTHNSNLLCDFIKCDWCRYFCRGARSRLGFPGNERGVIWSCKPTAFGNGIAFSHNFDRSEMESRETRSLKSWWRCDFLPCQTSPWTASCSSELLWQHLLLACLSIPVLSTIAGWWCDKLLLACSGKKKKFTFFIVKP